jgi:hypothetical protein
MALAARQPLVQSVAAILLTKETTVTQVHPLHVLLHSMPCMGQAGSMYLRIRLVYQECFQAILVLDYKIVVPTTVGLKHFASDQLSNRTRWRHIRCREIPGGGAAPPATAAASASLSLRAASR